MKLRIKGNSIRMRLTQGEVKTLLETGSVRDSLQFPGAKTLTYGISSTPGDIFDIKGGDGIIEICVPMKILNKWSDISEVRILSDISLASESSLSVLIEKDFKCLTVRPNEDESDLFPNPLESHE